MTRCVCHPARRCGRCDQAREIITATARDSNKEACLYSTDDAMCVLRDGHKGDHKLERYEEIVPFE